ncbi:MAG: sigma-70 family RNA polymerase sigma factor [Deltaproteobacteria bacterium]|nr:sigma-70 family RNA polymerase sigma factor [Deltaproteobacteria bacterium]
MNDADLVRDFRNGNREAFAELVRRYSRPVTMTILGIVRDNEAAKDISQHVFLKAFEKLSGFMFASSFKTWLYRIAINSARDHLRRRKRDFTVELNEHEPEPGPSASERLEQLRMRSLLRAAMEELPEKQRLTLQLRIYDEMDYKEIAGVLGGTEGSARVNFFQAVKTLRKKIGGIDEKTYVRKSRGAAGS